MKSHEKVTVELDGYQVANLRALIEATGYNRAGNDPSPLAFLMTGDWIGEVYWKLPASEHPPNRTPEQQRDDARRALERRRSSAVEA